MGVVAGVAHVEAQLLDQLRSQAQLGNEMNEMTPENVRYAADD
jgi:hypothetical protein